MTDNLKNDLIDVIADNLKEKLCLIEDVFKLAKHLYAQGRGYTIVHADPGAMFDTLYEQSIDDLTLTWSIMSAELSQSCRKIGESYHNFLGNCPCNLDEDGE